METCGGIKKKRKKMRHNNFFNSFYTRNKVKYRETQMKVFKIKIERTTQMEIVRPGHGPK